MFCCSEWYNSNSFIFLLYFWFPQLLVSPPFTLSVILRKNKLSCSMTTKRLTKPIRGRIHKSAWNEQENLSFPITYESVFLQFNWNQCKGKATALEQVGKNASFSYEILLLSMTQAVIKTGCWNWEEDQKELEEHFCGKRDKWIIKRRL